MGMTTQSSTISQSVNLSSVGLPNGTSACSLAFAEFDQP